LYLLVLPSAVAACSLLAAAMWWPSRGAKPADGAQQAAPQACAAPGAVNSKNQMEQASQQPAPNQRCVVRLRPAAAVAPLR
jgi:hypothetical protein